MNEPCMYLDHTLDDDSPHRCRLPARFDCGGVLLCETHARVEQHRAKRDFCEAAASPFAVLTFPEDFGYREAGDLPERVLERLRFADHGWETYEDKGGRARGWVRWGRRT